MCPTILHFGKVKHLNFSQHCVILSIDDDTSDILSEIDGIPSHRLHVIGLSLASEAITTPTPHFGQELRAPVGDENELHMHLRLRGLMNMVLDNLYTMERAYCRPVDIADVVTDLSSRLDRWYWSLPVSSRFLRHPSAFNFASNQISEHLVGYRNPRTHDLRGLC